MENCTVSTYRDRFWDNLNSIKDERGLSWNALASRIGIPATNLFHAKRLKAIPRAENMQAYADALEVPVSRLFDV